MKTNEFFSLTLYFIAFITSGVPVANAAPQLPRGSPPQPATRQINVLDFGANPADDDFDDTQALNTAIKSATNYCTLYFPAGTYNVKWVAELKHFDGLSLQGDGADKSILKRMGPFWKLGASQTWENLRANYGTDAKLLRIEDCRNMAICDLGFDMNGTPTFGGVGIIRPRRLNITCTRVFDSREQPPLFGRDRFGWVILGFEQGSEDIWFTDNVVEGLQTELDSTRRVLVERNIFRRSVKSLGLGFLSGNFANPEKLADGYANTDITVRRNYFANSDNLSMGMLTFQLDPANNCNSIFRNVDILENIFVYSINSSVGHPAIKLGAGDNSLQTHGNMFEGIRIEGNRIYRKPGLKSSDNYPAYIWFNCWEGTFRLHRTTIRGNRLYADDATKPLVKIGRQEESRELVVEANTVHAYTEPPAAGEFLAEDRQCYNK